jgi:polyisoprenoid-binding protein YceI
MLRSFLTVFVGFLWLPSLSAGDVTYRITSSNNKIGFTGTKPNGKHDGGFKEFKGTAAVKDGDVTKAQIKVEIDMTSIFTDTPQVTNHLKTADFFDVKKYPKATFVSTKIEKKGDDYLVTGKLTMHGVTKELSFPAKVEANDAGFSLESNFEINRHDWKVSYGPGRVDDMVKLSLSVSAPR